MKKLLIVFCALLTSLSGFHASPLIAEETDEHVVQGSNVFVDYQNYNHGYCPVCNCYPCKCGNCPPTSDVPPPPPGEPIPQPVAPPEDPSAYGAPPCNAPACNAPACAPQAPAVCPAPACAPVCGTECGISICAIGIAIAALATAAVLIVSSGNGSTHH